MAKISFPGFESYEKALRELGADAEKICKAAVYDGAAIVADAIRASYYSQPHPYSEHGNEVIKSMTLSKIRNDDGYVNTKVGFVGYDSEGTATAIIARTLESGNSHQRKKPFIRPAVNRVKQAAIRAMGDKIDQMTKQIVK